MTDTPFHRDMVVAVFLCIAFLIAEHHVDAPHTWNRFKASLSIRQGRQMAHGQWRRRLVFALLGGGLLLSTPRLWSLRTHSIDLPLLLLAITWLGWSVCSLLWSENRALSLRRLAPLLLTVSTAWTFGMLVGIDRGAFIVTTVSALFLLFGLMNEIAQKTLFRRKRYRFAGTLHPNQQGVNCSLLCLCSFYTLHQSNALPWPALYMPAISGLCLLLTRSRSACWALLCSIGWWAIGSHLSLVGNTPGVILLLACLAVCLVIGLSFLTRDRPKTADSNGVFWRILSLGRATPNIATLTGRTALWSYILDITGKRRLTGLGFGAFWSPDRLQEIEKKTGWRFAECHCAYLEILAGTGLIGAVAFFVLIGTAITQALSHPAAYGLFLSSVFLFALIQGISESTFALPNFSTFSLFLLIGSLAAV